MNVVYLALYIVAAVCFVFAAYPMNSRLGMIAAGLLAWVLVPLIHTAHR